MVSVNKYIINDNEIFIVAKIEKLCEKVVVVRENLGIGEQIRVYLWTLLREMREQEIMLADFTDHHRVLFK